MNLYLYLYRNFATMFVNLTESVFSLFVEFDYGIFPFFPVITYQINFLY